MRRLRQWEVCQIDFKVCSCCCRRRRWREKTWKIHGNPFIAREKEESCWHSDESESTLFFITLNISIKHKASVDSQHSRNFPHMVSLLSFNCRHLMPILQQHNKLSAQALSANNIFTYTISIPLPTSTPAKLPSLSAGVQTRERKRLKRTIILPNNNV